MDLSTVQARHDALVELFNALMENGEVHKSYVKGFKSTIEQLHSKDRAQWVVSTLKTAKGGAA